MAPSVAQKAGKASFPVRADASPMWYAINLVQYVAVASGSDLFSFALP